MTGDDRTGGGSERRAATGTDSRTSRRRVLAAVGAAVSTGLAGCGGRSRSSEDGRFGRRPEAWHSAARDAANTRYAPDATPAGDWTVEWRATLGGVDRFPPLVTDGGVFVCTREALRGFDRDGTERWSVALGEDEHVAGAPTAHATGGWVALGTSDGRLRLFDARTGSVEFERAFASGLDASVVAPAYERLLYVATEAGRVHAFRRGTDDWTPLWTHEAFGAVEHAPAVGEFVAVGTSAGVEVLDTQGRPRWRRDLPSPAATRPTLVGETVLVGTRDHALYAFDAETGERRWWRTIVKNPNPGERIEGVAATPGRTYVTDSRAMHALSYDGQRRWRHHDWERSFGPPVAVGDAVLAVDGDGVTAFGPNGGVGVGSLRPDPVRWRFTPDGSPRGLAVVGDRAYLTVAREGEDELLVLA